MKGKNDDSPDPESPPLRSIAAAPDPFPWSLATAVAARSQWGDWFESRDGEGEEEDYTTRATACNMQKGPPRLELVRLFASTSGMQVGEGDWAFYGGAWGEGGEGEFGVQLCRLCQCEPYAGGGGCGFILKLLLSFDFFIIHGAKKNIVVVWILLSGVFGKRFSNS